MGFFDRIKRFFDRGGIGLSLNIPRSFKWQDGSLPATVTLKGHKEEPRSIFELSFTIVEDEKTDDSSSSPSSFTYSWTREGSIDLAPGEEKVIDVVIPLVTEELVEEEVFGREAKGFAEKAFMAVVRGSSPEHINRFRVTVAADVDGATKPKRASRHITQRVHRFTIGA